MLDYLQNIEFYFFILNISPEQGSICEEAGLAWIFRDENYK